MIKVLFESLEDPERPLLGPIYLMLKKLGLIIPSSTLGKAMVLLMIVMSSYLQLTQYVELYMVRSDIDELLNNIKYTMLCFMAIAKIYSFLYWQKYWREVIDFVTEADKYERDNCDDEIKTKILDSYTKYSRKITYSYYFLVFLTKIAIDSIPLGKLSSASFRSKIENGTEKFPHIFSSWMPFDKNIFPGNMITLIFHILICTYGGPSIASYDLNAVVIMIFFGGKLDLMRERCKQILGSNGKGVRDEQVLKAFRHMHEMHTLLIKYSKLFNSLLSPVMFCYVVICSLMLCSTAYQITSAVSMSQKLFVIQFFIFGVCQLFLFCWHSTCVLEKSESLLRASYESEWWAANVSQRKNILLLTGQFNQRILFTAGPFTNLTLNTLVTILKGTYSFYTILRK